MATPGQVLMPAAVLTTSLGAARREPMRAPWLLPMEGGRIISAPRNAMNQGNPDEPAFRGSPTGTDPQSAARFRPKG
jgi:hypothetical protein